MASTCTFILIKNQYTVNFHQEKIFATCSHWKVYHTNILSCDMVIFTAFIWRNFFPQIFSAIQRYTGFGMYYGTCYDYYATKDLNILNNV